MVVNVRSVERNLDLLEMFVASATNEYEKVLAKEAVEEIKDIYPGRFGLPTTVWDSENNNTVADADFSDEDIDCSDDFDFEDSSDADKTVWSSTLKDLGDYDSHEVNEATVYHKLEELVLSEDDEIDGAALTQFWADCH